jgi:hypothetical protein
MIKISFLLAAFLVVVCLCGCSVAPSESTVERTITHFFENGHYKVVDLKIGRIEDTALSEKTYMGTPGYVVAVVSITLEPLIDKGADIRKGEKLTFTNASILVRQDAVNKDEWHVSVISGISAP